MPAQPSFSGSEHQKNGVSREPKKTLVDMALPATDLHVRRAVELTIEKLCAFQIVFEFQFTIEIVLAEILNNIVEHGYADGANGSIHLTVSIAGDRLVIETVDQGVQMPGLEVPRPLMPNLDVPREDLPEGNFGWFMIRKLVESLDYRRHDGKNHLVVSLTQSPAQVDDLETVKSIVS